MQIFLYECVWIITTLLTITYQANNDNLMLPLKFLLLEERCPHEVFNCLELW